MVFGFLKSSLIDSGKSSEFIVLLSSSYLILKHNSFFFSNHSDYDSSGFDPFLSFVCLCLLRINVGSDFVN